MSYENKRLINEVSKLRLRGNDKTNDFENEINSSLRNNEYNMKINKSSTFSLEEKLLIANDEKKSYEAFINKYNSITLE